MNVGIVIVNWNSGNLLFECLQSIKQFLIRKIDFEVVIVDNGSTDLSIQLVENTDFSFPLKLLKNSKNCGFARACNQGANACANNSYLLFLNPDTRFLETVDYSVLLDSFDKKSNIGILGVQLVDDNGIVVRSCARFPSFFNFINSSFGLFHLSKIFLTSRMTDWDHSESRIVDQVMGSFFLIKRELFAKLNGFDERFFVYYEELDLSYRANQVGFFSYYDSEIRLYHKGGGTSSQVKDKRLFYSLKSKLLYIHKHFSWLRKAVLSFSILFFEPLTRLFFCFIRLNFKDMKNTLRAYKMLYLDLLTTRAKKQR